MLSNFHVFISYLLVFFPLHGSQPCDKGVEKLSEAMSHAMQDDPKWTRYNEEFWENVVHWGKK